MKNLLLCFMVGGLMMSATIPSFRDRQKGFTRVREAYVAKEKGMVKLLGEHGLNRDSLRIYLRAFKAEKVVELWGRNLSDTTFVLLKSYPICEMSGETGPKRRVRDLQVPEGFYHITQLNPFSKYHLSMQINYPNASDSVRGVKGLLGSLIFIHGGCESSGCLAMTDDRIKELYLYCVEAYHGGQQRIEMTIYPARLDEDTYARLVKAYAKNRDYCSLWADLKRAYDLFEAHRVPPRVRFLSDGAHQLEEGQ